MPVIHASELARNTSAVLERILSGERLRVVRNRTEIAELIPVSRPMNAAQAISGLANKLTPEQGAAWLEESRGDWGEELRDPWA